MEKDLLWIIYLADGRKELMTQSEFFALIKVPEDFEEFYTSNEPAQIDGIDITNATREDCENCFIEETKKPSVN